MVQISENTFIYALCEPETLQIKYIGKSDQPQKRFYNHLNDRKTTHKVNWLNQLKSKALVPVLKILEEVSKKDWEEREKYWISFYKNLGNNLTNSTNGGDGVPFTQEIIAKISQSKLGHFVSEETRRKISKSKQNITEELRKKLSDAHKGKPIHINILLNLRRLAQEKKGTKVKESTLIKMSKAQLGKKHSVLTKTKLSQATTRYMSDPQIRMKQSEACKRQWQNPEYRKKRSEETKKLWENPEYHKRMSLSHKKVKLNESLS